ncbi:MAG: HAMP domain-containing sensor histidine kinase [Acidobacteriota bacterium]|nr:HAMP domain-containing sensor histidine kinase [Acidobacteriota bacterium]
MAFPSFIARSAQKLALGGAVAALAIWVAAEVVERTQLGPDLATSRARLQAEVSGQFAALGSRLDAAATAVTLDAETVGLAEQGDAAATRRLFDQAAAGLAASGDGVAVTIYGARNQPLAWVGRSEDVPDARLTGSASQFLAQSTQGLQLVHVQPVVAPADPARHLGAIVAGAPLSPDARAPMAGQDFSLETSIVPVSLRLQFEGAADAGPDAFIIRTPAGEPLAAVQLSDADLTASRQRIRERRTAAEIALAAVLLLLFTGALLDWRRSTRSLRLAAGLTLAMALLIIGGRALLWIATRRVGLAEPALVPASLWSVASVLLASPVDFLLTGLAALGVMALATSTFALWRVAHRPGIGVVVVNRPVLAWFFLAVQVMAGAAVTALVVSYTAFLRTHVSQVTVDILRFAIEPRDWDRLLVVVGLLALNAAVIGTAVLILRAASSPWVFAASPRAWRWRGVVAWLVPAAILAWPRLIDTYAPLVPTLLAILFTAAAALTLHQLAPALPRGSRARRLLVALLALVLPSVVLYPSLVDAAGRARRQLVAERYAPEVLNQRSDLRLKVSQALVEIDRIDALDAFVEVSDAPPVGPPPTGAAFHVWSQTSLASQRLTSSVELHNSDGAMVSRFALNLPDNAQGQAWNETLCEWEMFEEVSPFFSEERRLLHAGRAICAADGRGRRVVAGSVVVHSMLDYSNLSFITAQNPYAALMRAGQPPPDPRPRAEVELYVYGWSRRVMYSSVEAPPTLTEDVFRRAYESREPFWTTITRGSAPLEVYVMSDRAAIYVLGTADPTAFGHVVTIAELVALAFAVFVLVLLGAALANFLLSRAPATGRALLAEVRASFYQKLFLAFVLSAVIPVLALALVSRAYMASLMFADIESEATRLANVASRVVEDVGGQIGQSAVDDNIIVWLSRVIAQDVNIFEGAELLASSERDLFASGLLPTRTPDEVFRAILLDGQPSFVGREMAGGLEYLTAATPVRIPGGRQAVLTVPLTSRQQETQAQIEELDRRVLLAAVLFIMLGAGIGYYMAERIADPVNRLMRATRRIARGNLDARVLATSADELRRLVEAFNQMAADLQRQRQELERTNRLAAWADMARQVAHDIKNPLTPIQLNAEHLRRVHMDQGKPLGSVIDDCVSNILGQVRLLRQLSSEFSSFASAPEPNPVVTNLSELVAEIIDPYRSGLAGRVTIETHVPAELPPLRVDRMLVGRALTNVIENALHAMPGGGELTIAAALAPGQMAQLRITDTGIGMDADALARIFEPYFSTKAIGTGLGLTIAKRNTEANGGTISVDSERGRGTSVTLTLPLA